MLVDDDRFTFPRVQGSIFQGSGRFVDKIGGYFCNSTACNYSLDDFAILANANSVEVRLHRAYEFELKWEDRVILRSLIETVEL